MFNNVASKGLRVISYQVTKKLKRTNDLRISLKLLWHLHFAGTWLFNC